MRRIVKNLICNKYTKMRAEMVGFGGGFCIAITKTNVSERGSAEIKDV